MKTHDEASPLPPRRLRFSRRMVGLSIVLIVLGVALAMCTRPYATLAGLISAGAGFALFFSAGYYWACDNESCS